MADIPTLEPAAADVALADDAPAPRKGKGKGMLIALIAGAVILAAGGAGAWYLMSGPQAKSTDSKAQPAVPAGPALYVPLDPPFVTNFEADQVVRFLQITVQVMTHDPATAEMVKANDPLIRNDLLLLFGNQKYSEIATREGKEHLRAQALETVRRAVAGNGGKSERVEAVYFTSFVMQ